MNLQNASRRTLVALSTSVLSIALSTHADCQTDSAHGNVETKVFDPSFIDKSVDPCVDFYRYSCNGWFKQNPIPPDKTAYGRDSALFELNRLRLREILEQAAIPSPTRSPNQQKIGDEYASCMDSAAINKLGLAPIQPELYRIDKMDTIAELPTVLAHLHWIGAYAFFWVDSEQDYANSDSMILFINAGGLGLPDRDYYTRTDLKSVEQRKQYAGHVSRMFVLAGAAKPQADQDAQTVLAIETRLAKASLTIVEVRDPQNLNHSTDEAAFAKQLSHFSFPDFLTGFNAPFTGKMNVTESRFFAEFNALLADTPLDEIKTYLRWQLLHSFAGTSMSEPFDDENWRFYRHDLNGAEKQEERWKRCVGRIDSELGEALGQAYVAKYFPPEEKQQVLEMTNAIEGAMGRDIDSLDWMSAETKLKAKEKLHAMANKIGYPDKWRDYSSLNIVRGDAFGNGVRENEFDNKRGRAKIGKPVDRREWITTPPTVNAFYNPKMNDMNFPAGILQPPFFDASEPDENNYGDLGSVIGHELTHGFDDQGRQFDKAGNLLDWWTKEDGQRFNDRAACVVKQYDAIEAVPGVHLNGKQTIGENIADLGGVRLAWLAWQNKAQGAGKTSWADGYTPEQRFWVAYAQSWCTQTRPEQLRTRALTDTHSSEESRVNAVVSDIPDFARTFKCSQKAPMVNPTPCRVW